MGQETDQTRSDSASPQVPPPGEPPAGGSGAKARRRRWARVGVLGGALLLLAGLAALNFLRPPESPVVVEVDPSASAYVAGVVQVLDDLDRVTGPWLPEAYAFGGLLARQADTSRAWESWAAQLPAVAEAVATARQQLSALVPPPDYQAVHQQLSQHLQGLDEALQALLAAARSHDRAASQEPLATARQQVEALRTLHGQLASP